MLTRVREEMLLRRYSPRTVEAYVAWIRRFVRFHGLRHPAELGAEEVSAFLSHLATELGVSASTQNQALAALLLLYGTVLGQPLEQYAEFARAKRPERLPSVLSAEEVGRVLDELEGATRLMAELLYGSGLRLMECAELRVKDVSFDRGEVLVRQGKGAKDRVTPLPRKVHRELGRHLQQVRGMHAADLADGAGWVELPRCRRRFAKPGCARGWTGG